MPDNHDQRTGTTLDLARQLIQKQSVTPNDAGCQTLLGGRLEAIGFDVQTLQFDEVTNLWARRGSEAPLLIFAGHTDVVPAGPVEQWGHPPFSAEVAGGMLHGRGAADMKGSLAAMITAAEAFLENHPRHRGSIGFLITSDEEGAAVDGTASVVRHITSLGIQINYCVVGEPTSSLHIGDMIKVGRRGSLTAAIRINGRQGHVAYPHHHAFNPVPPAARLVDALEKMQWDQGNEVFPPTTFQVSNFNSGTGAGNVIPGHADILCNFRFSPVSSPESLKQHLVDCCEALHLDYSIEWTLFGMPFQTPEGVLLNAVKDAIENTTGLKTECSTSGGTSDGRFIAPTGAHVVELGPVNETIHRVNEQVSVADLATLSYIYEEVMCNMLG